MDFSKVSYFTQFLTYLLSLSTLKYVQNFGLILSHEQSISEGFYSSYFNLKATLLKPFLIVQKPVKLQLLVKDLCICYAQYCKDSFSFSIICQLKLTAC